MTKTYKPQVKRLSLEDYPEAIAEVRAAIARCDQKITALGNDIERRKAKFDRSVSEDKTLRNDNDRKAAWKEFAYNDLEYQGWLTLLQNQEEIRTQHDIKLELLRSAFTVAKLQARRAIADQISGTEGFSLVA
jgi:hypothetical protein